jgi:plastocyanin
VAAAEGQVVIGWYDTEGTELQFALRSEDEPLLAVPSPSPLPEGGGGAPAGACEPQGPGLSLEAPPGAVTDGFAQDCLAVEAGQDFTVDFNNNDTTAHNFSIYTDDTATEALFDGSANIVDPGQSFTYEPDPIEEEGEFFFHCDLHPTTMTGTFVVAAA